jgi:small subunit ribosomal protein S21
VTNITIYVRAGDPIEKAIRRLRKAVERTGLGREMKSHQHFEKPSEAKRRRARVVAARLRKAAKKAQRA